MSSNYYHIKISPEVINNDLFVVPYNAGSSDPIISGDPCCDITTTIPSQKYLGYTYTYSGMSQILSAGVSGTSLLTGLTIPLMLTENTVDIGYYSPFDGFVTQQDTMLNFIFTGRTSPPYSVFFYNTSDVEFKKYLAFSSYMIDWGDGITPPLVVTPNTPTPYTHVYSSNGSYTITMSGMSPWGYNIVKKKVHVPFSGVTVPDPYGTAFFQPLGGSWAGTQLSYNYLFSGDAICDVYLQASSAYTSVPFIVSGYTKSSVNDLAQYYNKNYYLNKFFDGQQVTGTSGCVGVFNAPSPGSIYTAYTINDIDYWDYSDGTTIFFVNSSGMTPDMMTCSAITKDEVLLNVIDQAEVQSNVYVERGKNSGIESINRLGEVDNIGDMVKYGYKFFNVINI